MKKIAIYCVNYNSYKELYAFVASVDRAAHAAATQAEVTLFVADNTTDNYEEIRPTVNTIRLQVFPFHENYGYFGSAQRMMATTPVNTYDYVAISNVDLTLAPDAISRLADMTIGSNVGWIAPCLYSTQLRYDRNPSVVKRYTKKHLQVLRAMYRYSFLHALYKKTLFKRHGLKRGQATKNIFGNAATKNLFGHPASKPVYAGHGSFIILTKAFIATCGLPSYPLFLYGEELYLAELCRQHHLTVEHKPAIRISDTEHVSTRTLQRNLYYRYNYNALDYILRTFYS